MYMFASFCFSGFDWTIYQDYDCVFVGGLSIRIMIVYLLVGSTILMHLIKLECEYEYTIYVHCWKISNLCFTSEKKCPHHMT